MAHDVFLVAAHDDADPARLIARRLRALKFKVWYDPGEADEAFDARQARAALDSQTVLVLWSAAAVKNNWVRAAAAVGNSKPGLLLQAALDKTVPYEPFKSEKRYSLDALTSRAAPEPFYQLVEELGRRDGRADLRAWINFGPRDEDKRAAWIEAHPTDPIARDDQKKKDRAAGIGLAAASRDDVEEDSEADGSDRPETDDLADVRRMGAYGKGPRAGAEASGVDASNDTARAPYLNPPYTRAAPVAASAAAPRLAGTAPRNGALDDERAGAATLAAITGMIGLMLLAGWANRSAPVTTSFNGASMPAIANARMPGTCPAGTVPAYLIRSEDPASQPLQHGVIIDDTTPQ